MSDVFNPRRRPWPAHLPRERRELTDADIAAMTAWEPKPTRIPRAHWRNVYEFLEPGLHDEAKAVAYGCDLLGPNVFRTARRHVSREIAEQVGLEVASDFNREHGSRALAYLRAEKFEGEGP